MAFFDLFKGKTAEEHFALATEKIQNELYKEAISSYNKAIEKDPNYVDAYHDRALAKDYLQDYFEAIRDFDKAIELESQDVMSYYNRARSKYSAAKQVTEAPGGAISAQTIFSEAIEDNLMALKLLDTNKNNPAYVPENIKQLIYLNNGLTRNSLEDFKLAIDDFTKAIKIDENYADAYQNRAVSHMCLEDFNNALKDAEKALELGNTLSQEIIDKAVEAGGVNYLEGLNESFYDNGKIKEKFHVKNGKLEGVKHAYFENGQIKSEYPYVNDKFHGTIKSWYEDGQLLLEQEKVNGKNHGTLKMWHENGQQSAVAHFKDGEGHGSGKIWYECGQLKIEEEEINDELHGLKRVWHQNGQLEEQSNWNHGFEVFDGTAKAWYENGVVQHEKLLIEGKIIYKQYDSNGKLENEVDFTSGEFLGSLFQSANEQAIQKLLEIVLWNETEELGDEVEGILDEIGYVSPIPKSVDIIKQLTGSYKKTANKTGNENPIALKMINSFKAALKFNKKTSQKK